jgi:DNA-binding beta-propeller fold protein YncE
VEVGAGPAQIALTPDGRTLVSANRIEGSVSIVDIPSFEERERVRLDRSHPHGIALDGRGVTAFLTYEGDIGTEGGVIAVDLPSAQVVWAVTAGAYTLGIAYVAD